MGQGNASNVLSGPATVFVDPTGLGDFINEGIDIGATSPEGVRALTDYDIPGFEIDQININVGHTLNTAQPKAEFQIAELTLENIGYFVPGAGV